MKADSTSCVDTGCWPGGFFIGFDQGWGVVIRAHDRSMHLMMLHVQYFSDPFCDPCGNFKCVMGGHSSPFQGCDTFSVARSDWECVAGREEVEEWVILVLELNPSARVRRLTRWCFSGIGYIWSVTSV